MRRESAKWRIPVGVIVVAALTAGVGLRFIATSDLWLDEALSTNIARLPLAEIPDALRQDGHPPLYYVLLHVWMRIFGDSDFAVRSLSGVFAVATLPLVWLAGRRYGGRTTATVAVLLLASSPFAIRYAVEARMYSLLTFLVVAGWLLVRTGLERPRFLVLAGVAGVSGALLLTHYWAFYLVGATLAALAYLAWRSANRRAPVRLLGAVGAGGLLFLPWLSGFLFQLQHTGTPWTRPERPANVIMLSLQDLGGGAHGEARLLGVALAALLALALFARPLDRWRLEFDLRTRADARPEALVVATTLALGVVAGYASGTGFATRYVSVILPLVILLVALGVSRIPHPIARWMIVSGVVVVGLLTGAREATIERTQGGEIGRTIAAEASPNDLVVFCPDQLGPAVSRHLPSSVMAVTFPEASPPDRVDWVDYAQRNSAADATTFAASVVTIAADGDIWLVWSSGYRTLETQCNDLHAALSGARPARRAVTPGATFESAELVHYPAT